MPDRVLLISDLHLEEQRPDITAAFKQFLQRNQGKCSRLFILGDLFEVWIGDDAQSELAQEIAASLHAFSEAGSAIYLMHGNRDFLLGDSFSDACGAKLIAEPYVLTVDEQEFLLLHGDSLCTDDVDYQEFRTMVRDSGWQAEFLAKSIEEREAYAQEARRQSQLATGTKTMEIMDVNEAAVEALFAQNQQQVVIHGHTHRPAIHQLALSPSDSPDANRQRIVLGDWDKELWYAEIVQGEADLHSSPLTAA